MPRVMKTIRLDPITLRPGVKLDRRMREMLHELHDHRTGTTGNVEKALHTQDVGAAQCHKRFHAAREHIPVNGLFAGEDEAADTVAMRRLGEKLRCFLRS